MGKIPSNLKPCVKLEIEQLLNSGNCRLATLSEIDLELASIGYKLDRSMDCRHIARTLSGFSAGNSYPAITGCPIEADTGLSASHSEARRDANFCSLQQIRLGGMFAIVNGTIFTF